MKLTALTEVLTYALAQLSPADLSSISLVSRRFHGLVTTPHAWRTAFSRFFSGPDSLITGFNRDDDSEEEESDSLRTERRAFTRLSGLASWRSEYIIRTRLLRSLARGKPVQNIAAPAITRTGQSHVATPIIMYNSQMLTTVNHIHATFGNGLNERQPRFVHGADDVGTASSSDPVVGKIDPWGLGDPTAFIQFSDRYPGDAQYGLGTGEIVGVPNSMDVSQPHGVVYGEGLPDGLVYFRFAEEMRGRFLVPSAGISIPRLGVPKVLSMRESICSVWIAKKSTIPSLTDGLIGIMAGSSLGVLTAYSLGPLGTRDQRYGRGEMTARWVLSPGVPIIALAIDEQYSSKRQAQNRIWAMALNALGEVFFLTKFPKRSDVDKAGKIEDEAREEGAWLTGRSVYWNTVEPSRRATRPNPYERASVDGSYSPRSSWSGMSLSSEQTKAETREIEAFLAKKPKDFQRSCLGWDMRRRFEVDFANDDDNGAGEIAVVFGCGLEKDTDASIKRYTRCRAFNSHSATYVESADEVTSVPTSSLFGGPAVARESVWASKASENVITFLAQDEDARRSALDSVPEEWRSSTLSFGDLKGLEITATATDCSTFATITKSEDPLLNFSSQSSSSSPSLTPQSQSSTQMGSDDVPGQRARLIAAGTKMGTVLVWNMRASIPQSGDLVNDIEPVRLIHTESPQISCLGLTSLYLVHGGNDGLVQAWDPLASTASPIRTLNSRFSSRARRRLVQAQASPQGVGINLFAAGAMCLDPDATTLRGMVSVGTHLRYWSYSSSAADQYKSSKRRLRRPERGSNYGGERFPNVPRGNFKDYIANERHELQQETVQEERQAARLAGRFGTDLLGDDASEEEMLAYARLLSEESLAQDSHRRQSDISAAGFTNVDAVKGSALSNGTLTPEAHQGVQMYEDDEFSAEIAEAIRQSLEQDAHGKAGDCEWNDVGGLSQEEHEFKTGSGSDIHDFSHLPVENGGLTESAEGSNSKELSDLEFALQLSLAEEQSRKDAEAEAADEFPALSQTVTQVWDGKKGKGRAE